MMPGKGLVSILVKLSFEEVHVQSGHVLFWKAPMNSMTGCRTCFRKCRICSWKLHLCLFNIKYIFFEKHKLSWTNPINTSNSVCIYIYGNMYNKKCRNHCRHQNHCIYIYIHFSKMLNKQNFLGKRHNLCRKCSILVSRVLFTFQTQCQNHWWKHISCKINYIVFWNVLFDM